MPEYKRRAGQNGDEFPIKDVGNDAEQEHSSTYFLRGKCQMSGITQKRTTRILHSNFKGDYSRG
jgi:hypothetical protein